jgi:nitroimidazol reductase NimA-like FMN-containing flavoprotein (pyridoxamine 5'-phosphate oxidase superfamily)
MYKSDRQVTNINHIESIFKLSYICRIAFHNQPAPYIIPMNYGYYNNKLYLHTANKGLKLELLKKNNNVGFEIENELKMVQGINGTTMKYQSIVGQGVVRILETKEEKQRALKYLIEHHSGVFREHSDQSLASVTMLEVTIKDISAKANL